MPFRSIRGVSGSRDRLNLSRTNHLGDRLIAQLGHDFAAFLGDHEKVVHLVFGFRGAEIQNSGVGG